MLLHQQLRDLHAVGGGTLADVVGDDPEIETALGVKALEDPVDVQIKAEESRREIERIRKAEAEANRIAALNLRIDEIKAVAARAVGKPSAESLAELQKHADPATELGAGGAGEAAADEPVPGREG